MPEGALHTQVFQFVKLCLSLPDLLYTLCTVQALIVPLLAFPVILGVLFLTCNNIIVDHTSSSVLDSVHRFDLLYAPPLPTQTTGPWPSTCHND